MRLTLDHVGAHPTGLLSTSEALSATRAAIDAMSAPVRTPDLPSATASVWSAAIWRRRSAALLGGTCALSFLSVLFGIPVIAASILGAGAIVYSALVTRDVVSPEFARRVHGVLGPPLRAQVHPHEIIPEELRSVYLGILLAHEDIRVALGGASRMVLEILRDVYARCSEMVQAAGRVARNGNAAHDYLTAHGLELDDVLHRLDDLGALTEDEQAARAFRHAASTRRQHVELHKQIRGLYDRVWARLLAVMAFLGVVRALVVKLQIQELELAQSASASLTEAVDELRMELEVLESSLEGALSP